MMHSKLNNINDLKYSSKGKGQAVVFLHGDALDQRQWRDQVVYFANKYRVITYDLRGYGKSPLPIKPVNHPTDLKVLLDSLGTNTAHLVGSSFGGEQAIDFSLLYPEKVKSLTIVDSSLSGYRSTVNWDTGAFKDGLEIAKHRRLNHEVFAQTKHYPEAYSLVEQMVNDYSGYYWMNMGMVWRMKVGALKKLREISIPTMVMIGEHDMKYFKMIAQIVHNGITHSTLYEISNAGHLPNLELPQEFNHRLEKCLEVYGKK